MVVHINYVAVIVAALANYIIGQSGTGSFSPNNGKNYQVFPK